MCKACFKAFFANHPTVRHLACDILALSKSKTQDNDEETLLNLVSCFSRVGKLWTGRFSSFFNNLQISETLQWQKTASLQL